MKTYHYMDDLSAVRGPVELASLAKLPPDTLVREVGTTKWIALSMARRAGGLSPQTAAAKLEVRKTDHAMVAMVMAGAGLILTVMFLGNGSWFSAAVCSLAFWAGAAALVAIGTAQKPKAGYLFGLVFGPLGFTIILAIGLYRIAQK